VGWQVPKIQYVERVIKQPRIVTKEKIVEVPNIQYRGMGEGNNPFMVASFGG